MTGVIIDCVPDSEFGAIICHADSARQYAARESCLLRQRSACWLRSPQGQVLLIYHYPEIKTTASGAFSFNTFTGDVYPGWNFFSEGALGVYAMSCRGNLSGATAIAEFTVTGGVVDP